MSKLLKASEIIAKKTPKLISEIDRLTKDGLKPHLEVIIVGNNPASEAYVGHKEKFCKKINARFTLTRLPEDVSEKEFLASVERMNNNSEVTGCFVQLPIPKHLQHLSVTQLIHPKKDVDGFHLNSVCEIYQGNLNTFLPCTPKGILEIFKENKIEIEGKDITVIGRSHIVGKPLALILQSLNATVTLCHSRTKNLSKHTKNADIIISAVGKAEFLDETYLRNDSSQVLIDVGINKVENKLVGDIKFNSVKDKVMAITPVPGGVGPMTVLSLMENLIKATEQILNQKDK